MASSINASTSGAGGVITTADNTGILNLQSAGTTVAALASTGLAVTGTLSASGVTTFAAGTAALPAITTTGDTNTGIFFSAADTIDFAEGGTACGQFDSSANFKFNSGYGSVATAYGCRAWVSFNGTGTVAIRGSGNVSSITDGGVGIYTVNMTTAIVDANYSVVTSAVAFGSIDFQSPLAGTISTTLFDLYTSNGTTSTDSSYVFAAVFR